jgi:hypothetical protein
MSISLFGSICRRWKKSAMQEMSGYPGDSAEATPAIILADDLARDPQRSASDAALMRRHGEMLLLACGIIALSLVLKVRGDDHAALVFLPDWPIPASCPSQVIFGVDCPGCGLTRSFIHLAHGDWHRAFLKHRVGWLLALAVVLQVPYRLAGLLGRNHRPLGRRIPELFGMALIVALMGNWVLRLLGV